MFQLKSIFALAVVASLTACSSAPDRDSSYDPEVIVDTAPGINGSSAENGSGVEVLGLNQSDQNRGYTEGQDMDLSQTGTAEGLVEFEPVIYFELDQYELDDQATEIVKHYSNQMLESDHLMIKIKGHTDERGTPEYNLALGERRAKSVAEAMMLFGVSESRIDVISYGEEQPVDGESNEAAWQKNRRAELLIR